MLIDARWVAGTHSDVPLSTVRLKLVDVFFACTYSHTGTRLNIPASPNLANKGSYEMLNFYLSISACVLSYG